MMRRLDLAAWVLPLLITLAHDSRGAEVPGPESHLGFRAGADGRLVGWKSVCDYFHKVDRASDRVSVRVLGESTEGRPYLAAFISSAETIADLDRYRKLQQAISDPRIFNDFKDREAGLAGSKTVVVITCSIHSTETASTLMAMELLHELAGGDDPATREILDKTILILIPSANPDGVDKVATWYEQSKGHPWEGSGMIELYHKYAGHDTNRDWFMLNLKETKLLTKLLYKEWFPTILYDVHQMGTKGARLFVPPFYDPVNPNLDPRLSQGIFLIGAHMASDLADAGKKGILTNAMYDNWWNGGNRTTPQRHNIVAVLTEAASVRMASPLFLADDELKGATRGFNDHKLSVNFTDPWPGGWWRLRDIVEYEKVCARSLLTLAARYREPFQKNLANMASDAIERGKTSPPYAWIVSTDQRDPGSTAKMLQILHDSGIEIHRVSETLETAGVKFPEGTWLIPAAQPYRAHVKDLLERQVYPERLTAGGKAEPPYDVAGWTLPLQMGVRVVEALSPLKVPSERLDRIDGPKGSIEDGVEGADYLIANEGNDDITLLLSLADAGIPLRSVVRLVRSGESASKEHSIAFSVNEKSRSHLDRILPTLGSKIRVTNVRIDDEARPYKPKRVALYQPWVPNMDEGWTRFVLESFKVPYTTVHNAEIRAGKLKDRFDSLLIPAIDSKTLKSGYMANETEPRYVGGIGPEGAAAIRDFLQDGGKLVCLDASCEYAIEMLDLPVKNVLKGLSSSEFYAPGSILRTIVTPGSSLTFGLPQEIPVYFDRSLAFDLDTGAGGANRVPLRYASSNPLESGWLLGPAKIAGKAALVEIPRGKGSVVLFGFRPQHRGQTHGTFRLLFNALLN